MDLIDLEPLFNGESVLVLDEVTNLFDLIQSILWTMHHDVTHDVAKMLVKIFSGAGLALREMLFKGAKLFEFITCGSCHF